MESQSGLQMLRPRIYGALLEAAGVDRARGVAAIVIHPASNFHGHYLLEPLMERGISCMGLNTRYVNNDSTLLMERVIQDLGAGIQQLRAIGYRKVMLIGNSGGAALVSFYQAQAERLTLTHLADGAPISLAPADLPPVEGIALAAAHAGRARLMREWIDPAVIDESDPMRSDPGPGPLWRRSAAAARCAIPGALSRGAAGQARAGRGLGDRASRAHPACRRRSGGRAVRPAPHPCRAALPGHHHRSQRAQARQRLGRPGYRQSRGQFDGTIQHADQLHEPVVVALPGRRARTTWRARRCRCCTSPIAPTRACSPARSSCG